jgi:hypothetical protein
MGPGAQQAHAGFYRGDARASGGQTSAVMADIVTKRKIWPNILPS